MYIRLRGRLGPPPSAGTSEVGAECELYHRIARRYTRAYRAGLTRTVPNYRRAVERERAASRTRRDVMERDDLFVEGGAVRREIVIHVPPGDILSLYATRRDPSRLSGPPENRDVEKRASRVSRREQAIRFFFRGERVRSPRRCSPTLRTARRPFSAGS